LRYLNIDTISFTDVNGISYPIKDIRPIPNYKTLTTIKTKGNDKVDEIISRETIYGNGREDQSYKIYDHNKVIFVDARFDMNKIKELKIPI
jgi:hypothetical protein